MPEAELLKRTKDFAGWVCVFGSDEAVETYSKFMQGSYHSAPPQVLVMLYAEFVLAARRDMGDPDTSVSLEDILSIRIKDLYSDQQHQFRRAITQPFADVCRESGWDIPWVRDPEPVAPTH